MFPYDDQKLEKQENQNLLLILYSLALIEPDFYHYKEHDLENPFAELVGLSQIVNR
jgi:hypothetical protein